MWERQPGLFPEQGNGAPVGAAAVADEIRTLARTLPPAIRLGTSSWSFPGWAGSVYDRPARREVLARHGLAAYARHPLLRTVGIDRSYYAPLSAEDLRAYAAVVPEDFRFVVKAHELCTIERFGGRERHGARRGERNPRFLDPGYATEAVVAPFQEGLGAKGGALVFQFTPQRAPQALPPDDLASRLHDFLTRLPAGPLYAVEIRHRPWLSDAYAKVLRETDAVHCVTVHPSMPAVEEQARVARVDEGRGLVVRWNLRGQQRYEEARERYAPFDRLVEEDRPTRHAIAELCLAAARAGREALVTINNKAEGSAPLSAVRLAERIGAAEPGPPAPAA